MRLVHNFYINLRFDKLGFAKLRINVYNDQNELEIDLENPFLICGDCTCTFCDFGKIHYDDLALLLDKRSQKQLLASKQGRVLCYVR